MRRGLLGLFLALILSGCVLASLNAPDDADPIASSELPTIVSAKFTVPEPYASYYAASGGSALFGAPVSQLMAEDNTQVQYFQNIRLEWDHGAQCVRLSKLGDTFWKKIIAQSASPVAGVEGRYYSQTNLTVFKAFLPFYDAKGGPDFYGYPVSALVVDSDGRYVQYFDRVRLDWYPEDPKNPVRLGPLGEAVMRERELKAKASTPDAQPLAGQGIVAPVSGQVSPSQPQATLTASVKNELTGMGGNQTVSLRLLDAQGRGIPNVTIEVVVHDRKADRQYVAPVTDADGYTACIFPIGNSPSGYTILVDAIAKYQGHEISARTSYTPWY